jgi:hypothetical protein
MSKRLWFASIAAAACAAFAASPLVRADDPKPEKPATPPGDGGDKKEPAHPAAPAFKVKDVEGKERTLEEFKGKWVVLEWTNLTCPYVKKFYDPGFMQDLQKTYTAKGVVWLSVCSSAEGKPGNMSPEDWKKAIAEKKIASTAVLLDLDGTMGHAYGATNTPQVWLVCPKGTIYYTGAMDDNRDKKADPAKSNNYLKAALDAVLAGKEPPTAESQPYG